jgi:hypothetical protein
MTHVSHSIKKEDACPEVRAMPRESTSDKARDQNCQNLREKMPDFIRAIACGFPEHGSTELAEVREKGPDNECYV